MQQIALQNCRLTVLNLIKEVIYLRQISGNKLLVKALKEEGVDYFIWLSRCMYH